METAGWPSNRSGDGLPQGLGERGLNLPPPGPSVARAQGVGRNEDHV